MQPSAKYSPIASLIKQQVPIGSHVTFWSNDGHEIAGILVERGPEHVTLAHNDSKTTIVVDTITRWETKVSAESVVEKATRSETASTSSTKNVVLAPSNPQTSETLKKPPKGSTSTDFTDITVKKMFDHACEHADGGHYAQAIAQIQKVLSCAPNFPQAQEKRETWHEYERRARRLGRVPRGKGPFAQAKRARLLEENFNRAMQLYELAITQNDRAGEAVKELVDLHEQLGNIQNAIDVLKTHQHRFPKREWPKRRLEDLYIGSKTGVQSGNGVTKFARFFLQNRDYQVSPPDKTQKQKFDHSDIQKLDKQASNISRQRPRERARYYFAAAARLRSDLNEEGSVLFCRYLGRGLASMGDAAVFEHQPLESAQDLYLEALIAYDGALADRAVSPLARNALVRFLYTMTFERSKVPIGRQVPQTDTAIREIFQFQGTEQRYSTFESISHLISRSNYAAGNLLRYLDTDAKLQSAYIKFLQSKGIHLSPRKMTQHSSGFAGLQPEIRCMTDKNLEAISKELRPICQFHFADVFLKTSLQSLDSCKIYARTHSNKASISQLQNILKAALDLCKQDKFEERERLCNQIESDCRDFLKAIKATPTKLDIEAIYPVVETIEDKTQQNRKHLYRDSVPDLSFALLQNKHTPNKKHRLKVDIGIANRINRSPAEALELIVSQDDNRFELIKSENKLDGRLEAGTKKNLTIDLRISERAIQDKAFSLPVYAKFRTRTREAIQRTDTHNLRVRLDSSDEFISIDNPYATYAEGSIVDSEEMFFGRSELIRNIARVLQAPSTQGKSIVIFGQKRSGKSSVLFHLKKKLECQKELLILDIGNIASNIDESSGVPFPYQFLWSILQKFADALEDKEYREGIAALNPDIPSASDFFAHPTPITYFKTVFDKYQRQIARTAEWRNVRIVLLIDEFSYIHQMIVESRIPESFMKNWKALLQENYFSVVLVGQDDMPKFKEKFPNEFGTTQDERVTYLREEDAQGLIEEPTGGNRYIEQSTERILELTAGSPFYIQIFCNRLVEYMNRERVPSVSSADVERVKHELVRGVNALSQDKFDNLINSGDASKDGISDQDILNVLKAIALASQNGSCTREDIDCETDCSVENILDDLVQRDVIKKEQAQYSIRVGLFKEWLVAHT